MMLRNSSHLHHLAPPPLENLPRLSELLEPRRE